MKRTTFLADEIDQARKLLGLGELASIAEIKTAYRHLCKQWHPDALDDDATTSGKIKDINAAYRLLLDTVKPTVFPSALKRWNPSTLRGGGPGGLGIVFTHNLKKRIVASEPRDFRRIQKPLGCRVLF